MATFQKLDFNPLEIPKHFNYPRLILINIFRYLKLLYVL